MPETHETWAFNLHWSNDEALYRAVLRYAAGCLRRVPNMTDQTLGLNVKNEVRRWCEDGYVSDLGWSPVCLDCGARLYTGRDHRCPVTRTVQPALIVSRSVLDMLAEEVGDFSRVNEESVAEDVREALGIEEM